MSNFLSENPLPKTTAFPRALACLNALEHGGTSSKLFILGEDPALFDTLMDEAFALHQPATTADAALVADSVHARWMLWRRQRARLDAEQDLPSKPDGGIALSISNLHHLELLDRYQTRAERALQRALANVRNLRNEGTTDERWRAQLNLQKERTALEREKFELLKAKDARFAAKQEAQALRDTETIQDQIAYLRKMRADIEAVHQFQQEREPPPQLVEFSEKLNCHVIRQIVDISCHTNGEAQINLVLPSHEKIRHLVENAHQYQDPPRFVLRTFKIYTAIPDEYQFLLDLGYRMPAKGELVFDHPLDFNQYKELADLEDEILEDQAESDAEEEREIEEEEKAAAEAAANKSQP